MVAQGFLLTGISFGRWHWSYFLTWCLITWCLFWRERELDVCIATCLVVWRVGPKVQTCAIWLHDVHFWDAMDGDRFVEKIWIFVCTNFLFGNMNNHGALQQFVCKFSKAFSLGQWVSLYPDSSLSCEHLIWFFHNTVNYTFAMGGCWNFQMNGLPCFFDNSWMRKCIYWFLNSELGPSDQITSVLTCLLDGM